MKPETQYKLLVKVASADRAAGILARIAGAQQVKTAVDASTLINAGAGLGGAALGAGAGYALSGLSPAMKKKKLYRILAALGGGAAGGAAGYFGASGIQGARAKQKYIARNGIEPGFFEDMKKNMASPNVSASALKGILEHMPPEERADFLQRWQAAQPASGQALGPGPYGLPA